MNSDNKIQTNKLMNNNVILRHFYSLDFLKIISTFIIVFHHYQQVTETVYDKGINFYYGRFYFGYFVELFFIISGFLTYKYISLIKNDSLIFKDFFIKKTFRYYISVPITVISFAFIECLYYLKFHFMTINRFDIFNIISSCFLVQHWGLFDNPMLNNPIWYISVLIFCYIVFYFICWFSKIFKFDETYFFILFVLIGLYIKFQDLNLLFLNSYLYRGYVSFFLGLLLFKIYNTIQYNTIQYNILH